MTAPRPSRRRVLGSLLSAAALTIVPRRTLGGTGKPAPSDRLHVAGIGIDASWHIAIHLAVKNGLVFGEEFLWPYGPLSFLVTRLPIGIGKPPLLLFDAFLVVSFVFILLDVFRRLRTVFSLLLVSVAVIRISFDAVYTTWADNVLFSIFLYTLFRCLERESFLVLTWSGVTALLAFFVKVNVGFMAVRTPSAVDLRVFERGSGETLACGTGACAAVVSGRLRGLLDEQVSVRLPGGILVISWPGEGEPVWMTGPAAEVLEGIIEL